LYTCHKYTILYQIISSCYIFLFHYYFFLKMLCDIILYHIISSYTILYDTIPYHTILYYVMFLLCYIPLHCIVLNYIIRSYIRLYYITLYRIVSYCIMLCYVILSSSLSRSFPSISPPRNSFWSQDATLAELFKSLLKQQGDWETRSLWAGPLGGGSVNFISLTHFMVTISRPIWADDRLILVLFESTSLQGVNIQIFSL